MVINPTLTISLVILYTVFLPRADSYIANVEFDKNYVGKESVISWGRGIDDQQAKVRKV